MQFYLLQRAKSCEILLLEEVIPEDIYEVDFFVADSCYISKSFSPF